MQKQDYTLEYKPGKELTQHFQTCYHVHHSLKQQIEGTLEKETRSSDTIKLTCLVIQIRRNPRGDSQRRVATRSKRNHQTWMARDKGQYQFQCPSVMWDVRDELSEVKGIILKGERILVPSFIRKEMLERIHQGHMGIGKSKRQARDLLYSGAPNVNFWKISVRKTI